MAHTTLRQLIKLVALVTGCSWICNADECMFATRTDISIDDATSTATDLRAIIDRTGTKLLTTIATGSGDGYELRSWSFEATTGDTTLPGPSLTHDPGRSSQSEEDAVVYAAPLCTSRDESHVYVVYPVQNEIEMYEAPSDTWTVLKVASRFSGNTTAVVYVGISSADDILVIVTELKIERYSRNTSNGSLVRYDEVSSASPYVGITAATSDSSGDWLVCASTSSVVVIGISGPDGAWSVEQEIVTTGTTLVTDSEHAIMAPDDSTVYFALSGTSRIVAFPCNASGSGAPVLVDSPFYISASKVNFLAIAPNGKQFFAFRSADSAKEYYVRNLETGILELDCEEGTTVSAAEMVVDFSGSYVFLLWATGYTHGASTYAIPQIPTPAPTPSPSRSPTPPTQVPTPSPTRPDTLPPNVAPSPAPNLQVLYTPPPTVVSSSTLSPQLSPAPNVLSSPAPSLQVHGTPPPTVAPSPTPRPQPPVTPAPTVADSTAPSSAPISSPQPSLPPLPDPTSTPYQNPSSIPTPAPSVAPTSNPDPPMIVSATLLDTEHAFKFLFDGACYCDGGNSTPSVACADINATCAVDSVFDNQTAAEMGSSAGCVWSDDSTQLVVYFDEEFDKTWSPNSTILLSGGYIHGDVVNEAHPVLFTSGAVTIEGRTTEPELHQAQFSDDGTSISIWFSSEGSPSSGLLDPGNATSGKGPGSCASILDAASVEILGDGATCQWTGDRQLDVSIGHGSVAVPAESSAADCGNCSSITLLDGGVRTEAFAVLSSSGSIPILSPDNPASVSVVLVAPETVGLCGDVKFDARASSGGASRSLSAVWDVSGAADTPSAAVVSLREAFAPFNGSLLATLNVTAVEVGEVFTVSLAVENFLGSKDETTTTVVRTAQDIPSVVILGSSLKTVQRSRSTTLHMIGTAGACGTSSPLTFDWDEVGGLDYDELGDDVFAALAGTDPTKLILPAYELGYAGSIYLFRGIATSQESELNASALVEVLVEAGPVRASISGGEFRLHAADTDLVLDGSESTDEDNLTALPLRYNWSCSENCSSLSGEYTSGDSEIFTIPAANLQSNTVYEFSLNVSKGVVDATEVYAAFRSDLATIKVHVVSYDAPDVVVRAKQDSDKFDPATKLVLYGGVADASSSHEFLWSQESGDLSTETDGWSTLFSTSQTGPNLVVRPDVLTGGSSYVFRLSAVHSTSRNEGYAELSVVVNSAPYGGRISASPATGIAVLDPFVLEALDWTDEADDLPLTFSFSYSNGEGVQEPLYGLSAYASESPEWTGALPLGPPADNYTISIAGHVSDSFGASTIGYTDGNGNGVTVRVTGWETSSNDTEGVITALSSVFFEAVSEAEQEIPGQVTSLVRACASVLVQELNETSPSSSDLERHEELFEEMVNTVTTDYHSLDYSTETAASILGVLATLSGASETIGLVSKGDLVSSSTTILADAVEYGNDGSAVLSPVVQLLDGVLGSLGDEEDLNDNFRENLSTMVHSIMTLLENGLEDGEEAGVFDSTYVDVSCAVTSDTNGTTLIAGTSKVSFAEEAEMEPSTEMTTMAATSVASAIRQGEARSNTPVRSRHLESVEAASTSAVGVGFIQFPVYGRTSEGVKGGVTSVRFTSTDDGSDIPLTAPAAITMTASLTSASVIPWCAYYNQETAGWEADGLVIGSASVQASDASDSNSSDVEVLCLSYHLSDFAVSTADSDGIFAPVDVTAALEVFSAVRNSSWGGIITVVGAVMVLIGIGVAVTHTGKGRTAEGIVTEKIVVRYVETGEATRNPTFVAVGRKQSRVGPRTAKRRRRTIPAGRRLVHKLAETRRAWYDRACALFAQVIQNHPWIAIVSPSTSNLALTPTQLSLLLFAQVMVQMMVEAAFSSNATSLNVKVAQVIVGSAATIPGSMLLPYLFEAAAAPPQSITTNEKWHNIALPARQRTHKQVEGASSSEQGYIGSRLNDSVAPTTAYEGAGGKDVKSRHRDNTFLSLLQLVQSAVPSPSTASSSETPPGDIGHDAVRGRGLVFTCMTQILLDLVCLALSVVSGWDTLLRQILVTASAANVLLAVLTIDAVLAARTSMFSLLNFKAVLGLAFTRVCVSLLQAVTAFQDLRTRTVTEAKERRLELVIFVFAALKIIACYTGEILPSMDATRKTSMSRLSWAKKYRPGRRSSMRKSVSGDQVGHKALMIVHDKAATRIQALVRMEQACKRSTRKKEIMQWHSPEVYTLRRKLTIRAYAWLGLYAGTAVWINLCFVFAYDTPTIRSWVTATGITIAIEIVFRKPLSVLVKASIQTLRNIVSVPGPVYVGKGANRQPLSRVSI